MCELILENPDKLQITKIVEDYNIFFKYDGKNYLLHRGEDGYEEYLMLYGRNVDKYGVWNLVEMNGKFISRYQFTELIKPQKGKTIVYNLIDKNHFIEKFNQLLGCAK